MRLDTSMKSYCARRQLPQLPLLSYWHHCAPAADGPGHPPEDFTAEFTSPQGPDESAGELLLQACLGLILRSVEEEELGEALRELLAL